MTAEVLNPRNLDHLSFSQHGSYWRCPGAYELERVARVPAIPAWWFIGGAVVHEATEAFDRLLLVGPVVNFVPETETRARLDDRVKDELTYKNLNGFEGWLAAGRWPNKSGYTWWWDNGPEMVKRYIRWREETNWEVAWFNDVPGIECELRHSYNFGDFTGAPDRVFRLPSGETVVADVKSGSTLPKDALQLGTYANMLEEKGFQRPKYGTYVMVKNDPKKGQELHTPLVPLDKYTTPYLEKQYGATWAAINAGIFPRIVSDACRTCVVQKGCFAAGGEDSARYDRYDPNYEGSKIEA